MLRRRAHLVLAVLALTLGARLAAAGTSLWVRSDPDDPVGGGVERAFGSADGSFTGDVGSVTVDILGTAPGENHVENRQAVFIGFTPRSGPDAKAWNLMFAPATLAVAAYPHAQANDPMAEGRRSSSSRISSPPTSAHATPAASPPGGSPLRSWCARRPGTS